MIFIRCYIIIDIFYLHHSNTHKWKNVHECAKKNCNTPDANGKIGRHTGGNIGNADHRKKLESNLNYKAYQSTFFYTNYNYVVSFMYNKATGKDPSWLDMFMMTRLDNESKKKYFEGDRSNLNFF